MDNLSAEKIGKYYELRNKYSKRAAELRKQAAAKHAEADALFPARDGSHFTPEYVTAYAAAREAATPIYAAADKITCDAFTYELAARQAADAITKTAANAIKADMIARPEYWTGVPFHYKKFENMVTDYFENVDPCGGTWRVYHDRLDIEVSNYSGLPHGYDRATILYVDFDDRLTVDRIEKYKTVHPYSVPETGELLPMAKKAVQANKKMRALYTEYKNKCETIRAGITGGAFYDFLLQPATLRDGSSNRID